MDQAEIYQDGLYTENLKRYSYEFEKISSRTKQLFEKLISLMT
jgi:hypothetical protein